MKVSRYNFKVKPKKPNRLLMGIAKRLQVYRILKERDFKCEYVNMEGIKPPYFLLANHASEMDFRILFGAIYPYNMNYVVAIDAMHDNTITLMRMAGGIAKRKFIKDLQMIKHVKYCVDHYKNPV